MKVLKFGGSSVAGANQIKQVTEIIRKRTRPEDIIVVSALGKDKERDVKVTDLLIQLFEAVSKNRCYKSIYEKVLRRHYSVIDSLELKREIIAQEVRELQMALNEKKSKNKWCDQIVSFGERMATKIIAAYLNKNGIKASPYNSYDLGLLTDSNFGNAKPLPDVYKRIKENVKSIKGSLIVVTGFIGKDLDGDITTLGRGGSDYTAAIFAAALDAEALEIWTDVSGIKTTDPKIVRNAKTIGEISYEEAKELSYYGAKLHPKTILPAMKKNIPVYIFNTFDPEGPYTKITNRRVRSEGIVKGIMHSKGNYVITISSPKMIDESGYLAKVFDIFGNNKISVDLVSTAESKISVTVRGQNSDGLKKVIRELKKIDEEVKVSVDKNKSVIFVVGEGMKHVPGVAGKIFSAMGRENINIELISQGASEINISFVVDDKDAEKAVKVLHREYFEQNEELIR